MDHGHIITPAESEHPHRWIRPTLFVYWVSLAVATHVPPIETVAPDLSLCLSGADKLIHFGFYVFLTLLLCYARVLGRSAPPAFNLLAAVGIAAVYAVVDELTQVFVGRTAAIGDVAANLTGVLCVLGACSPRIPWWRQLNWLAVARALLVFLVPMLLIICLWPNLTSHTLQGVLRRGGFRMDLGLDKIGHFLVAMLLTWLVPTAQLFGLRRPRLKFFVSLAVVASSAVLMEIAQIPMERAVERADLIAHGWGMMAALTIWGGTVLAARCIRTISARWPAASDASLGGETAFVRHATLVGGLTLVSRLTGVVRDAVLAAVLGLGGISDAFLIAFLIPNLFRRLFGEGALTASFIPTYAHSIKHDPKLARRVASVCVALLVVVLGLLTVVGEVILAMIYRLGDWHEDSHLAIRLTMIMLPYMPLICSVALIGAILQVHRRFGPPATAPIILNLSIILGTWFAFDGVRGDPGTRHAVVIIGYCVVLGGMVQLIWQLLPLRDIAPFRLNFKGTGAALRSILSMMLPMLVGLAVFQINAFLDSLIAFGFSPTGDRRGSMSILGYAVPHPIQEDGAVAVLQWSQRLYQFPLGVFGIAIATAVFPVLAQTAANVADPRRDAFTRVLRRGLQLTVFIGLPATVGLIIVRKPLTRLIFQHGAFTSADVLRVATVLAGYASAVWAYSLTHVVTRAFYALRDTRRPLVIALWMVLLNLTLNLIFIWPLDVAGLAWSTALCAAMQCLLLLRAIRHHVPAPVDLQVRISWARTAGLTAVMAVVLIPFVTPAESISTTESAVHLAVLVLVGVVVFFGGAWLIKAQELRWLWRRTL